MKYTSTCPPSFCDRFWEVRYMLDCWNEKMQQITLQTQSKWILLSARHLIAQQLIFNKHLCTGTTPTRRKKRRSIEHSLVMVPVFKIFIQGRLVTCKTKYGKWKCTSCDKFVHSYCSCTSGLMFCTDCFGNHCAELAMDDYKST